MLRSDAVDVECYNETFEPRVEAGVQFKKSLWGSNYHGRQTFSLMRW